MLVYRVVPGYWGIRLASGFLASSSEDALYDLGYLNMQKSGAYFSTGSCWNTSSVNDFAYTNEECKYFFLFPWDALINARNMDCNGSYHSDMEISILEYDIPQELLIKYLGFGYYDKKIPELRIPIRLLRNENPIFQECDAELIGKLLSVFQRRSQEFFAKINPFFKQELNAKKINQQSYNMVAKMMQETNQAELLKIYKTRLEELGSFCKCEYITGRYALFFGNDIRNIRNRKDSKNIINDSLVFLTRDTYQQWIDYWEAIQDSFLEGNKDYVIQKYLESDKGRMLIK